jgi:hypothetical protein
MPRRNRSKDLLFNDEAVVPPRPTISNVQWLAGTQHVTTADLDLLSKCIYFHLHPSFTNDDQSVALTVFLQNAQGRSTSNLVPQSKPELLVVKHAQGVLQLHRMKDTGGICNEQ